MPRLLPPRPPGIRRAAPLARLSLLAAGLAISSFTLPRPAGAQSIGAAAQPSLPDPWHGVVVLPPDDEPSPYEAARRAAEAGPAAEAAEAPATEATATEAPAVEPFDPESETAAMPSLWESIELGLGDLPAEPEPEAPKPNQLLPARQAPVESRRPPLPTRVELRQGAASLSLSSSASTTAPASGALSTTRTSGSGEIKGRLGLEQDNLTVYGTGTLSASASPGAAALSDDIAVGSFYSVPLAPPGPGQEKLGASVEVSGTRSVTTGVELRAPAGSSERFISVRRSISPDSGGSGIVKAGVLGRF